MAGSRDDVVADVVAGVLGTGYEEVLRTRPGVPVRRLSFRAPQGQGLPGLGMLVSRPGELIEGTDVRVPPETTGLRFAL